LLAADLKSRFMVRVTVFLIGNFGRKVYTILFFGSG
jgi:hypothetical protein